MRNDFPWLETIDPNLLGLWKASISVLKTDLSSIKYKKQLASKHYLQSNLLSLGGCLMEMHAKDALSITVSY